MPTRQAPSDLLDRLDGAALVDDYQRRGLASWSDQSLIDWAAARIGVPLDDVRADRFSFVLHAPLELLARGALLAHVPPTSRRAARLRIASLVAGYETSGVPIPPPPDDDFDSPRAAAEVLLAAVAAEDPSTVDGAAAWLGRHARTDEIVELLGDAVVAQLSAAGHGAIYLALLSRAQPRGVPEQMLRHPARALTSGAAQRIAVPRLGRSAAELGPWVEDVLDRLSRVAQVKTPTDLFIAPMVETAQREGVFDVFVDEDDTFAAADGVPYGVLRFAAAAMLQGPADQAPYGWTHCLTLAQAPLQIARAGGDPARAAFVACAYLSAHWAVLGDGSVDLAEVPEPVGEDLPDALRSGPGAAASAAWHAADPATTRTVLAEAASRAHDAHRVKYTLACLDASAADPAGSSWYLAAAAHLNAWWLAHPDRSDPLAGQDLDDDGRLASE
jgi:hypothetical protein